MSSPDSLQSKDLDAHKDQINPEPSVEGLPKNGCTRSSTHMTYKIDVK